MRNLIAVLSFLFLAAMSCDTPTGPESSDSSMTIDFSASDFVISGPYARLDINVPEIREHSAVVVQVGNGRRWTALPYTESFRFGEARGQLLTYSYVYESGSLSLIVESASEEFNSSLISFDHLRIILVEGAR